MCALPRIDFVPTSEWVDSEDETAVNRYGERLKVRKYGSQADGMTIDRIVEGPVDGTLAIFYRDPLQTPGSPEIVGWSLIHAERDEDDRDPEILDMTYAIYCGAPEWGDQYIQSAVFQQKQHDSGEVNRLHDGFTPAEFHKGKLNHYQEWALKQGVYTLEEYREAWDKAIREYPERLKEMQELHENAEREVLRKLLARYPDEAH